MLAEDNLRSAKAAEVMSSPEVLALLEQLRQSAPALTHALQRIDTASRSGALDTLLDLADVLHVARVSMSDGMVARMAGGVRVGLELADLGLTAAEEAGAEAAADHKTIGPMALLRTLKEPGVQYGLKFLLALARRLPSAGAHQTEV